jgi:hypothetical protein
MSVPPRCHFFYRRFSSDTTNSLVFSYTLASLYARDCEGHRMPPLWKKIRSFFADNSGQAASQGLPATAVVALVRGGTDRDLLKIVADRDHLNIYFANTCDEAWNAANRLKSPVVLCERDVPGLEWQDAVRILASAAPRPCVILLSKVVDDYLWKEIVAGGGYDVVASPLRDADAARSIKLALSYWKSTERGRSSLPTVRS